MMTKVQGIIIKEYTVGESDKFITLFTKELGKIQVGAPKAKKFDRGLAYGTQLFVYGEFVVSGHKNSYRLLSVEVITSFHHLSEDLLALSYAAYVAEFVGEVATESSGNEKLLALMLHTLHNLQKPQANFALIRCIFEMRAMALLGFMLALGNCIHCGEALNLEVVTDYALNIQEGGIMCKECMGVKPSLPISYTTWYTLCYIVYTPLKESFHFTVEDKVLRELKKVCEVYVPFYIEKAFKSLEFIKSIEMLS